MCIVSQDLECLYMHMVFLYTYVTKVLLQVKQWTLYSCPHSHERVGQVDQVQKILPNLLLLLFPCRPDPCL